MPPFRFLIRVLLGAFVIFLGIAGVSYMQRRFDDSDEKRALQAVLGKVTDIADPASCRTEIVSRVKGEVRVLCGERSWLVNVLGARIVPEKLPEKFEDKR